MEIIRIGGNQNLRRWAVASESHPGYFAIVTFDRAGTFTCSGEWCEARPACRHRQLVVEFEKQRAERTHIHAA